MRKIRVASLLPVIFACFLPACGFVHYGLGTFQQEEEQGVDDRFLLALLAGKTGEFSGGQTIKQIVAGALHTCALFSAGNVRCWGSASFGQLGYGNTNMIGDDETPASAGDVPVGGAVKQIAAGFFNTCALMTTGKVRCWGRFNATASGNSAHIGDNETPASVGEVDIGGIATQVTAGGVHNCALLTTGNVRCWGDGSNGVLGYGNTDFIGDNETPASAGDVNVGGSVSAIDAGTNATCAILNTGAVRCWGDGFGGQPGYVATNDVGDNETPASMGDVNVGGTVARIEVGHFHTCALLNTGTVRCWGAGHEGRLGYNNVNNIGDNETPASAGDLSLGGTATQLSAGIHHSCALLPGGAVRCWGWGDTGRPGYGNTNNIGDDETPASAGDVNIGAAVTQIATGQGHTCVLLESGSVRCWGRAGEGQLGYANTTVIGDDETPASAGDVTYR